mmetsp:Transcript_8/g.34  ORF Transcript_8/g.34 Transcript_8/m.34 type:complete len:103 (-) Transcript_8:1115-1423(-)
MVQCMYLCLAACPFECSCVCVCVCALMALIAEWMAWWNLVACHFHVCLFRSDVLCSRCPFHFVLFFNIALVPGKRKKEKIQIDSPAERTRAVTRSASCCFLP